MNKFKLSALVLAAPFVLTACGGGGGGGSGSTESSNQVLNNNNQPIYTPATSPVPGLYIVKDSNGNPVDRRKFTPRDTAKENSVLSALVIDRDAFAQGSIQEHNMQLFGKNVAKFAGYNRPYSIAGAIAVIDDAGTGKTILDLGQASLGSNLSLLNMNSVWGATSKLPNKPEVYVFATGDITRYYDNVGLMKGKAVYKGNATRYDTLSARVRHIGETTLHADFDARTIEGEIKTDDHRRNILLNKTSILSTSGTTQEQIRQQITDITTQINNINNEINKITQGSSNGSNNGLGNAVGESAERNGMPKLTDEQIAQIKTHQAQIESLKNNIEELKNTGSYFEGNAVAVGNHYFDTILPPSSTDTTTSGGNNVAHGRYRGVFFGPNAEEAAGVVGFDNQEDATTFSTVKQ